MAPGSQASSARRVTTSYPLSKTYTTMLSIHAPKLSQRISAVVVVAPKLKDNDIVLKVHAVGQNAKGQSTLSFSFWYSLYTHRDSYGWPL